MFQSRIYVTEHTWHMIAPLRIAYQGNKFIFQWPDNSKPGARSRTLVWHMASINITFHGTYFAPKTLWKHSRFPFQSPTAVTMYKLPPNSQYTIFEFEVNTITVTSYERHGLNPIVISTPCSY